MLNNFKGQDPSLHGSTEANFLHGCCDAFKENNKEEFERVYTQFKNTYDTATNSQWNKVIINKLYLKIQNGGGEGNKEIPDDYLGNAEKINEYVKDKEKEKDKEIEEDFLG